MAIIRAHLTLQGLDFSTYYNIKNFLLITIYFLKANTSKYAAANEEGG